MCLRCFSCCYQMHRVQKESWFAEATTKACSPSRVLRSDSDTLHRLPQLGVKTARILDASSCDSSAAGNVSVTFEFSDHKAARYLNWTPVTGQVWR